MLRSHFAFVCSCLFTCYSPAACPLVTCLLQCSACSVCLSCLFVLWIPALGVDVLRGVYPRGPEVRGSGQCWLGLRIACWWSQFPLYFSFTHSSCACDFHILTLDFNSWCPYLDSGCFRLCCPSWLWILPFWFPCLHLEFDHDEFAICMMIGGVLEFFYLYADIATLQFSFVNCDPLRSLYAPCCLHCSSVWSRLRSTHHSHLTTWWCEFLPSFLMMTVALYSDLWLESPTVLLISMFIDQLCFTDSSHSVHVTCSLYLHDASHHSLLACQTLNDTKSFLPWAYPSYAMIRQSALWTTSWWNKTSWPLPICPPICVL